MQEDDTDIPPFSEYILTSSNSSTMSLLREEQVISIIGDNTDLLKPAMVLSSPEPGGPVLTPLYAWRDVRALASELGVDCPYEPANQPEY